MSNPIPFRIVELLTQNVEINKTFKPAEVQDIEVKTQFTFGVNTALKRVRITGFYQYKCKDEMLVSMELVTSFVVEPQAFDSMIKDGTFTLETGFMQYLATINVGAARGEIHARCEASNSPLVSFVLPPINLVEAIKDKLEIKVS